MRRDNEKTRREMDRMKARGFEPLASAFDLPHIGIGPEDLKERKLPVTALCDENGWHMWISHDGKLQPIVAIPVESLYFSKAPEDPSDFYSHFLNFTFQRASYSNVMHWSDCILGDLHNLGASLAKLRFLFLNRPGTTSFARMAATELEYIFVVCRSLLDLLQEVVSALWPRIVFPDIPNKYKELKQSFADIVLMGNNPLSAEEIAKRHRMPLAFGKAYAKCGDFFAWFRSFRDSLAHSGKSFKVVYELDDGFGVPIDDLPFSKMPIWNEVNQRPNGIGSLHSAECYLIGTTFSTLNEFADLLIQSIRFPPSIAPGYSLYSRGPFIHELSRLEEGINETPWYSDQQKMELG